MKSRLLAVQRTLWMLLLASLVLCVLAFPRGRNRDYMSALEELTAFREAFRQHELESSLLLYAQNQGVVQLPDVAAHVVGPGVPSVRAKPGSKPVLPRAQVELKTLAQVLERAEKTSSIAIAVPRAAELADAIAWRLSRRPSSGALQLAQIEIVPAQVQQAQVQLERDVKASRAEALAAQAPFDQATQQLTAAEALYEARKKWKASWKAILNADQARKQARELLGQRARDLKSKQARYEKQAKDAETFAVQKPSAQADPTLAAAQVSLEGAANPPIVLQIPVALDTRQAVVPALQGTAFSATRGADLWDEVKDQTPDAAVASVRSHFTWQYQYVELGVVKIGGMTLLQFLPMGLPVLLALLLLRIRRVSVTYNPFGASEEGDLPRVGLGPRAVDLVVLSILPFAGAVFAVISLTAVSQIPIVPVLCGLCSLGLGAYAHVELGSLQSLIEAVSRSRSTPPPPRTS